MEKVEIRRHRLKINKLVYQLIDANAQLMDGVGNMHLDILGNCKVDLKELKIIGDSLLDIVPLINIKELESNLKLLDRTLQDIEDRAIE